MNECTQRQRNRPAVENSPLRARRATPPGMRIRSGPIGKPRRWLCPESTLSTSPATISPTAHRRAGLRTSAGAVTGSGGQQRAVLDGGAVRGVAVLRRGVLGVVLRRRGVVGLGVGRSRASGGRGSRGGLGDPAAGAAALE